MPFRHQISLSCCVTYVALSRLSFCHNNQTSDLYELTCLATHINTTDANLCNFLNPDAFDSPSLNNWWTWFNGNYCESGVFGEASPIGSQNEKICQTKTNGLLLSFGAIQPAGWCRSKSKQSGASFAAVLQQTTDSWGIRSKKKIQIRWSDGGPGHWNQFWPKILGMIGLLKVCVCGGSGMFKND